MAKRDEFLSQLKVIVDFAVKGQGEAPILTRHRLRTAADIDNRQPSVAEADLKPLIRGFVKLIAGAVRPPMEHQIRKADKSPAILMLRRLEDPSEYPAHCDPLSRRQSDVFSGLCPTHARSGTAATKS